MSDLGLVVEAAVVSPSARTLATWSLLAQAAGIAVDPMLNRDIYLGEHNDLAGAVRALDPAANCAVLVGHSPGCSDFVEWVTEGAGDAAALDRMRLKYPTAAAALLSIDSDWSDLAAGRGRLVFFEVCRG